MNEENKKYKGTTEVEEEEVSKGRHRMWMMRRRWE